jgi:transposase
MDELKREAYPSDVNDEEGQFVVPYLTLMSEDAPQREHRLREWCKLGSKSRLELAFEVENPVCYQMCSACGFSTSK